MAKDNHEAIFQKALIEDTIKQEFEQTLEKRVLRFMQVKPHPVVPYTHFSAPSAECSYLYRDGHFYGCIALTQAVSEALVRFLCKMNSWKPEKSYEKNVAKLFERKFIREVIKNSFLKIWERRDDYHHLNPEVERDRIILEKDAKDKVHALWEIEKEIFGFIINNGVIVPHNPKYWEDCNGQVFLKSL